jgi:hypothetical protein
MTILLIYIALGVAVVAIVDLAERVSPAEMLVTVIFWPVVVIGYLIDTFRGKLP